MKSYISEIDNFLIKKIPVEIIANAFYSKLSTVASFKRIKFELPNEKPIIANYYGMTFAPSGFGKDKVLRVINNYCFSKIDNEIDSHLVNTIKKRKKDIESQAMMEFGSDWKKEAVKQKWLADNRPRDIVQTIGDCTYEGLMDDRVELSHHKLGSLFYVNNEFVDHLISMHNSKSLFMTLLAEVFDHGDDKAKSLKTEKKIKKVVQGVPQNMLVYASSTNIHNEKAYDILINKMERQFARRCFIVFINQFHNEKQDLKSYIAEKEAPKNISNLNSHFFEQFLKIKDKSIYKFEKNVLNKFYEYEYNKHIEAESEKNAILKIELLGRAWKVLKLACVIHAFNEPEFLNIQQSALDEAIGWGETCSKQIKHLIYFKPKQNFERMWDFFTERLSRPVTSMDLRESNIFNWGYFSKQMDEFVFYAKDKAKSQGLDFEVLQGSGNTKFYILKRIAEDVKEKDIAYAASA